MKQLHATIPWQQVWQKLKDSDYSFQFLPTFLPLFLTVLRPKEEACGSVFLQVPEG